MIMFRYCTGNATEALNRFIIAWLRDYTNKHITLTYIVLVKFIDINL